MDARDKDGDGGREKGKSRRRKGLAAKPFIRPAEEVEIAAGIDCFALSFNCRIQYRTNHPCIGTAQGKYRRSFLKHYHSVMGFQKL